MVEVCLSFVIASCGYIPRDNRCVCMDTVVGQRGVHTHAIELQLFACTVISTLLW